MGRRSGDNLLIEIDGPIKGDVGSVDVQVIGLRSWVLGDHCLGLAVEASKTILLSVVKIAGMGWLKRFALEFPHYCLSPNLGRRKGLKFTN